MLTNFIKNTLLLFIVAVIAMLVGVLLLVSAPIGFVIIFVMAVISDVVKLLCGKKDNFSLLSDHGEYDPQANKKTNG